ncbi:MAG TPA: PDZ domain-containing protein [Terriglobia bacterium]|nr:PDZ domain-containing protein [Terriglobia bacterium]
MCFGPLNLIQHYWQEPSFFSVRLLSNIALLASVIGATGVFAASPPIHYVVDLRNPPSHKVVVTMTVPQATPATEIQFPAWNALYQIRDFVRGVEQLSVQCDGNPEDLVPVDVDTWRSAPVSCSQLEVKYDVYVNEEGIFSSTLNQDHCYLNLAMILFYLPHERDRKTDVNFLLPEGWKLVTLLEDGTQPGEYTAANYDAMVDCPAEAAPVPKNETEGNLRVFSYTQKGATYRAVIYGNPADYSPNSILATLEKITATETDLMDDVPFSRYTFILHFPRGPGGGGMEHRNGTAISVSADGIRKDLGGLESVAAHEFFHAWNVKRIRPQNLEPVDYVHGNDTSDLWFSEGVTSTYGALTLLRSGLISRREFYRRMADEIQHLQVRPARLTQSVAESGRDAWLEKYSDYHRPERSISYYNKGELLGFLLDLAIRNSSGNDHSLDDVMRRLNSEFAQRGRFFTEVDLRTLIANLAPNFTTVDQFFRDYVEGTAELDYDKYLGFGGLRLVTSPIELAVPGFRARRQTDGSIEVQSVDAGSNADRAGLKNGDVIDQMNGRALHENQREQMSQLKTGEKVELKVRRVKRTLKIRFTPDIRQETDYEIEEMPKATPEQLKVRNGWLGGIKSSAPGH